MTNGVNNALTIQKIEKLKKNSIILLKVEWFLKSNLKTLKQIAGN